MTPRIFRGTWTGARNAESSSARISDADGGSAFRLGCCMPQGKCQSFFAKPRSHTHKDIAKFEAAMETVKFVASSGGFRPKRTAIQGQTGWLRYLAASVNPVSPAIHARSQAIISLHYTVARNAEATCRVRPHDRGYGSYSSRAQVLLRAAATRRL